MAIKRPAPEEFVVNLRQFDVLMGQGTPRIDAIRQISVAEQTYCRPIRQHGFVMRLPGNGKKKCGGLGTEKLMELNHLQKENARLQYAVSDLTLDNVILSEVARANV